MSPGYHPPIAPKPNYVPKSPHEPSPPRNIQKQQADDQEHSRYLGGISVSATGHSNLALQDPIHGSAAPISDDLDGIDGGGCSNELESRLLRELIYAFQGIEGVMIKRKLKARSSTTRKGITPSEATNANAIEDGNYCINLKGLYT